MNDITLCEICNALSGVWGDAKRALAPTQPASR